MRRKLCAGILFFFSIEALILACAGGKKLNLPTGFAYKIPHTLPKCQGKTSTCWAFSTLSFLESEAIRIGSGKFDLSEMWVVYHTYLEKARNYIKNKGHVRFAPGGLSHDVLMILQKYGIVREQDYDGKFNPSKGYDHTEMDSAIADTLAYLVAQDSLDEALILNAITQILNTYISSPPESIDIDGKKMSPLDFFANQLRINLDDYIEITSFLKFPFYTLGKLEIPDNWWDYDRYYNVPIDEFVKLLNDALKNGFSVAIDMDMTESGYDRDKCIAWIPESEVKPADISQDKREELFLNEATTDDHLQHLVGYTHENGHNWFLIKDSLKRSYFGPYEGYFYMREDYVKLKVLSFMIHKDGVNKHVLAKFKNYRDAEK